MPTPKRKTAQPERTAPTARSQGKRIGHLAEVISFAEAQRRSDLKRADFYSVRVAVVPGEARKGDQVLCALKAGGYRIGIAGDDPESGEMQKVSLLGVGVGLSAHWIGRVVMIEEEGKSGG